MSKDRTVDPYILIVGIINHAGQCVRRDMALSDRLSVMSDCLTDSHPIVPTGVIRCLQDAASLCQFATCNFLSDTACSCSKGQRSGKCISDFRQKCIFFEFSIGDAFSLACHAAASLIEASIVTNTAYPTNQTAS